MNGIYKICSNCKHRVLRQKNSRVFAYCKLHSKELTQFVDIHMHCDEFELNPEKTHVK